MIVRFWGVRGSIPAPGPHTLRYGGNTTSVSVEIGERVLALDAGSGIRALGASLAETRHEIFLLLSHLHTDHLLGFPYFEPLYEPGRVVHLLDYQRGEKAWSLLRLLDGVHFPLSQDDLRCDYRRVQEDALEYLRRHGFAIDALTVNHPGGAYGYRIEHEGRSFVFIPDNELAAAHPTTPPEAFADFCRGADVLCHDAQYRADEMPFRIGWGHSCMEEVCALAIEAGVRHLVLFHHDPERTDDALDVFCDDACAHLHPHGIACTVAYEGLCLDLG